MHEQIRQLTQTGLKDEQNYKTAPKETDQITRQQGSTVK